MKQLIISYIIIFGISVSVMDCQFFGTHEGALDYESHDNLMHPTGHNYDNDNKKSHEACQQHHQHVHSYRHKQYHHEQQENHQVSPYRRPNKINVNDFIMETFNVSSQPGLHLFNNVLNTLPQHESSYEQLHHYQPKSQAQLSSNMHSSSNSSSSTSSSIGNKFKIQRSPDGKLNLVFDNSLQLQKPTYSDSTVEQSKKGHFGSANFKRKSPFEVNESDCLEPGKVFCSKVRNYPDLSRLNNIIKNEYPDLAKYFGSDTLVVQNISQRMNFGPDEEFLCKSREKVLYLEAAQNQEANWFLIVNNPNFKQGVRVEECEELGGPCNPHMSLPNGYYSTCKQTYIYRSLVALTPDAQLFNDQFKLPSCCKCVIKRGRN